MSAPPTNKAKGGMAFEIDIDRPETPSHAPGRLEAMKQHEPRVLTTEELDDKQKKAEDRRKACEAAKLERIQQVKDGNRKSVTE